MLSDLITLFRRSCNSWEDRMRMVLTNQSGDLKSEDEAEIQTQRFPRRMRGSTKEEIGDAEYLVLSVIIVT